MACNPLHVNLLVADDPAAAAWRRAVPDAAWSPATDATAARAALADGTPTVLVLDVASVPAAADVFRELREGAFGDAVLPTVLLLAEPSGDLPTLPVDEVLVAPVDDETRSRAFERAREVGEYRATVRRLYERSREAAAGDTADPYELSGSLRDVRALADERLEAVLDRPAALASLLWTPPDGTDG